MPTVGLCIITAELTDEVRDNLIVPLQPYVDHVYLQVNGTHRGKPTSETVGKLTTQYFQALRFKDGGISDFSACRNELLKEVKTDFWVWFDSDDTVETPEAIPRLVHEMESSGIDKIFALYKYAKNDIGEEVGDHWRERIIRTAHPYKWYAKVHETLISPIQDTTAKTDQFFVIHHKDQAEYEASIKRNHKILEAEYKKGDPRITMYLGMSYFTMKQWDEANALLIEHIQSSGSNEDKYRSWLKVAECQSKLGELDKSINACWEAIKLIPTYPDAYFGLGQFYYELGDYARCLEFLKQGDAHPDPTTLQIVDPTLRYRSLMMGALAEFQLGHVRRAWEMINTVLEYSPNYSIATKFFPLFEQAYLESEAIEHTKWLAGYAKKHKGKPINVLKALPDALAMDIRLNGVRSALYPPKVWPEKSIVFFCGPTSESWGPDMLDKGIGGSEEAVIYLSGALAKQGWSVTVYCDREEPLDNGTTWLPWHIFNPKDKFDVLIAWRNGQFFSSTPINARLKCVDLHDTPIGHATISKEDAAAVDKFFFKSQVQREMAENVPDDKAVIISNGIVVSQFKEPSHV